MALVGLEAGAKSQGIEVAEFRKRAEAAVPLGRFVTADEVARLALYIVSDEGSAMTGQAVNLDGGAAMW
jgi:enoyl-[acyl-carrier-protein] reductase (NADH)